MGTRFSSNMEDHGDPVGRELRQDPTLQPNKYPRKDGETLTLPDGRILGYAKYGASDAKEERTILFLHGTPGTRLSWHEDHSAICAEAGILVIIPERPGFGLSSPQPNRSLLSHALDIQVLLEHLNLKKVTVIGYSAGGPYALALAYKIPQRCLQVAVVSSLSPPVVSGKDAVTVGMSSISKFGYWLARRFPAALRLVVFMLSGSARRAIFEPVRDDFTEEENNYFRADIGQRRLMAQSILELYSRSHGVRAESEDYILFGREWGFELAKLPAQVPVFLYGGELDDKCTPNMYNLIARSCPNLSKASHVAPRHGHLYFFAYFRSLLRDLGLVDDCHPISDSVHLN
jgi:pimeloyl-ACP methyl ester carboxylesterase